MKAWLAANWDKLLGAAVTVGGLVFAAYRRFIRMEGRMQALELRLADHEEEDRALAARLDTIIARMDRQLTELTASVASQQVLLTETREDIRELHADIKAILARRG